MMRWLPVALVGVGIALVNFTLINLISATMAYRFETAMAYLEERGKLLRGLGVLLAFDAAYIGGAAAGVALVAPMAAGSGLPELRGYLNGTRVPGLLRLRTFVVKLLAIAFVIAAGLPLGREGPMVYLGAAVGALVFNTPALRRLVVDERAHRATATARRALLEDEKRLLITMGGAAGVAVAFNAPIGGVLYMFEEIASFWTHRTTMWAFLCTTVGAATMKALLSAQSRTGGIDFTPLVIFDDDAARFDWHLVDLPFFVVLAVLVGAVAAAFTRAMLLMQRVRRAANETWRRRPAAKIGDAVVVGLLIATVFYLLPLWGACKDEPEAHHHDDHHADDHHDDDGGGHADDDHRRRWLMASTRSYRSYRCDAPDDPAAPALYNDMASLTLVGEEGAIKHLLSRDGARAFSLRTLALFIPAYFVCAAAIAGLPVPIGSFVPNMLLGSACGRAFGELLRAHLGDRLELSSPGAFALAGAGACLGGFTRMNITIVVLLLEATGDIAFVIPLMLATFVANCTAARFVHAYDEALMHIKHIPFLEDETPEEERRLTADALAQRAPLLRARRLTRAALRAALDDERGGGGGDDASYAAPYFLIVDGDGFVDGVAERKLLLGLVGRAPGEKVGEVANAIGRSRSPSEGRASEGAPEAGTGGEDELIELEDAADFSPHCVHERMPSERVFRMVRALQLDAVVVIARDGRPRGVVTRSALLDTRKLRQIANLVEADRGAPPPSPAAGADARPPSPVDFAREAATLGYDSSVEGVREDEKVGRQIARVGRRMSRLSISSPRRAPAGATQLFETPQPV